MKLDGWRMSRDCGKAENRKHDPVRLKMKTYLLAGFLIDGELHFSVGALAQFPHYIKPEKKSMRCISGTGQFACQSSTLTASDGD